ncbi:WecB/TagA/CpsF family glycosyltransferase [Pedobacter sp.]|uniref:WecB/TagA/CpsF family glycosyltransferase n=1 Tax=Pedobacter sp. TaxID=1411316 RepID=UPI003D7F26A1
MPYRLPKKRIISINVSNGTYKQFVSAIMHNALAKISSYVCVANVHMVLEAYDSLEFKKVVNSAYLVTPDGMPIAKSFQILHQIPQQRVDGMSLLPVLLAEAEKLNQSVYFYGGTQIMLDRTAAYVNNQYPKLKIAGLYSPPFRDLTESEMGYIATDISNSKASLVFVVLGCPKQEKWMFDMYGRIPAIMIGIGGALPVLIGLQKRAPLWMQNNSLEWLYRLKQEPRRLFKRYFRTNNLFLYLLAKERYNKTVKRTNWRK